MRIVNMIRNPLLCAVLVAPAVFLLMSCGKKKPAVPPPRTRTGTKIVKVKKREVFEQEKYVYRGYKNRNPFIMGGGGAVSRSSVDEKETDSELSELKLTGIMIDMKGVKYALLSDSAGENFILKNGWIYDIEGNRIPSVTGTVFEERVVIISGSRMKELALPAEAPAIELE